MDYRSRSRRFCRWRPYRLTPAPRLDAPSCPRRCRKAAYRAARKGRDAYRQERGGFRGGTDNQTVMRPRSWRRRARIGSTPTERRGGGRKRSNTDNQSRHTFNQRRRLRTRATPLPARVLRERSGSGSCPFPWHALELQCVLHSLFRDSTGVFIEAGEPSLVGIDKAYPRRENTPQVERGLGRPRQGARP